MREKSHTRRSSSSTSASLFVLIAVAYSSSSSCYFPPSRFSCEAIGGGDERRYPSSIVTSTTTGAIDRDACGGVAGDISLGLDSSLLTSTANGMGGTTMGEGRRRRRRRRRYNDDDGVDLDVMIANYDDDDDDEYEYRDGGHRGNIRPRRSDIDRDRTIIRESSSRLHRRDIDECDVGRTFHRWRSPLEGLSPLPTTTPSSSSSDDDINLPSYMSSFSHVSIGPGMRQPHEIDVLEKIRQRTSSSYTSSPSPTKMKLRSTGTTIVALLVENSTVLILAADTRATDGNTVADKRCSKLHVLSSNVWCAGAGTSADVEAIVRRTRYALMKSGRLTLEGHGGIGNSLVNDDEEDDDDDDVDCDRMDGDDDRDNDHGNSWDVPSDDVDIGPHPPPPPASVVSVIHRLRSQLREGRGGIGANILAGGYDVRESRAILAAIHPHGSVDIVNYSALGSGGLAAMGVLESRYPGSSSSSSSSSMISCTTIEGIKLAVDAVRAGIENDLGSGSQIDVCVIGRRGVFYRRAVLMEEELRWMTTSGGNDDGRMTSVGSEDGADGAFPRISSSESGGGGRDIGVNGFGNVPFAIQSKRVVCGGRYELDAERERNRWLDEVLSP